MWMIRKVSRAIVVFALFFLTACGAAEPMWAPQAEVTRAHYAHPGPSTVTLFTVIGNKSGAGAHSGLMISAPSQRAMFDPAGTFKHPHLPERNDVLFGMSDPAVAFYIDYHARVTYHVVEQVVVVPDQVAELLLARIQSHGAVPKAQCAQSISTILAAVPGFETVPQSLFPKKLMQWFDTQDLHHRDVHYDYSPADNKGMIQAPDLRLRPALG